MKAVVFSLPSRHHDIPASDAWLGDIKPHAPTYFTAEMLHRTSDADAGHQPWLTDHFALDRMARELRRDNIARLVYSTQLWVADATTWLGERARGGLRSFGRRLAPVGRWLERAVDDFDARAARWQRERREAFLSQSTDVYDLERRMRALERNLQRPL